MGAVLVTKKIYDAFMQGPPGAIELFHGYTYSAHPIACAAGLATLAIYEREELLTRAKTDRRPRSSRRCTRCADCRTSSTSATTAWSPASSSSRSPASPGARAFGVYPQVLRARPADPHHRRHHRALTGADHRAQTHRRAGRHPVAGAARKRLIGHATSAHAGLPRCAGCGTAAVRACAELARSSEKRDDRLDEHAGHRHVPHVHQLEVRPRG